MAHSDIWNKFEKTDPAHTKQFNRGGFKGTAINGTYIVKKLTAEFGPCGKGWRFVIENERIDEGHALKSGDKTKVHVIRGHIDYMIDGTWYSTSPQFGQTMFVDENKNGTFTDEEAPKKSITDCISKCAVLLGVGADIHLGLFDDHKYVNQRRQEEAAEAAAANGNGHANGSGHAETAKRPVASKPDDAAKKWAGDAEAAVRACGTLTELRAWETKNDTALQKLSKVDTALFDGVMGVLADTYERVTASTMSA